MAVASLLATGCVTPPEGIRTVEGGEQNDVPVPPTYELQRSYTPTAAAEHNFRSWHGYYRGPGRQMEIAAWYVAEMPKHGWSYKGMEGTHDMKQLHFVKNDERSRIELYEEFDTKAGTFVNVVHAEVHPRGPEELTFEESLSAARSSGPVAAAAPQPPRPDAKPVQASVPLKREPAGPAPALERGEEPRAAPATPGKAPRSAELEDEIRKFEDLE